MHLWMHFLYLQILFYLRNLITYPYIFLEIVFQKK